MLLQIPNREFLLRVSYMEIYNETITDLLCDTQKMKPLIIREDYNVGPTPIPTSDHDLCDVKNVFGIVVIQHLP